MIGSFLDGDIEIIFSKRNVWIDQASIAGIAFFDNAEVSVVGLVGGVASNDKNSNTESEWLCRALENPSGNLQMTANNRVLETFDTFKPIESRLKIVNKLVDILINDDIVEFDPMATLQELNIDRNLFLQALTVCKLVIKSQNKVSLKEEEGLQTLPSKPWCEMKLTTWHLDT